MGSTAPHIENPAVDHIKVMKTFRAYLPSCHRTYSCVHRPPYRKPCSRPHKGHENIQSLPTKL